MCDDAVLLLFPVRTAVPMAPAQVVHQDHGVALVTISSATQPTTTQQSRANAARRHRAPAPPALLVRPRRSSRRARRPRPRAPKTPRAPLLPHSLVLRIERRRTVPGNSSFTSNSIAAAASLGVPAGIAVAEDGGKEAHEQRLAARQAGADEAGVGLDGQDDVVPHAVPVRVVRAEPHGEEPHAQDAGDADAVIFPLIVR